ncbi:acetyl-CoA carboxylase biotin carboxyl carrier protein [Oceanobacillus piezotolerans]|uniref:Biotin carboxyl carrier protein of acetyl-CoA carboxylase n=1 Tax=Oceanobacillus piezotolerans TaxID=2448030 RepID=A0A498DAH4_9BACI|nr:acetyl-CoA carboxylase biotin carboxyl carrier protein [Oceanobacillus piezotolerans]RLL48114.1 acetyl-CoA carboxylase biotin carboxyl carrier protein [Oceanobacillus piezotolerans]
MLKVQEIRELIKLIDQSSIDEFTYESDGTTVSMKKSNTAPQVVREAVINTPVQTTDTKLVKPEPVIEARKEVDMEKENQKTEQENTSISSYDHEIVSPMVGTFYSSPTPESDPFVSIGSNVQKDTIVCIVEAMKLFNEIEAEVSGEIVEILVDNGELVEYGQPLFRVKTK